MNQVVTAMVVGATLLGSGAMFASPVAVKSPFHTTYSKDKLVSFNLVNASKVSMKVKAGDTELTLLPGKTVAMKLAAGTKVVAEDTAGNYTAGDVLTVVSSDLSNVTITLN